MKKIALLSCTKSKQTYPCEAREMYDTSNLFKKARAYVEMTEYDDWFILSAKYGLLNKETLIEPYDITLLTMNAKERKVWSENVYSQLKGMKDCQFDFYAGARYREFLIPLLKKDGIVSQVPLQGLQIGKQLQFYSNALHDRNRKNAN
ncbi:hypothetical protein QGM71_20650 [Virgibacillus sp. C22-A2]|uniref:DUF6884 domain-containing protein n=1 Tax=Virgibacillus tibetensis TaxID=3042313 RepID=A0ABU6KL68_9BACI|nr:DUF6884 domain-containing protein [Virgibacillus sp. C22-A2]MEC5425868.1 hypothetical protein [Virgibacillus sp. C22-A2]